MPSILPARACSDASHRSASVSAILLSKKLRVVIETLILVLPLMLSPGPANLISLVVAARFGLTKILSFLLGIAVVYFLVALTLGAGTNHLAKHYANLTDYIRFFGGVFIVYLGIQLLMRTNRNSSVKAPSIWNGFVLQILNPKYPPVVLSVFAASHNQSTLITAGILSIVGTAGLLCYAATGAIIRHRVDLERQLSKADFLFGALLLIVGIFLAAKPITG